MCRFNILLVTAVLLSKSLCANLQTCTLPATANKRRCGYHASFNSETSFLTKSQIVDSVETCASYCARRGEDCATFVFDTSNHLCSLIARLSGDLDKPNNSTKIAYDERCFDCGRRCDQTIGAPLLDNGDFKTTYIGPWASEHGRLLLGNDSTYYWKTYPEQIGWGTLSQSWASCDPFLYEARFAYRFVPGANSTRSLFLYFGYSPPAYGSELLDLGILEGGPPPIGEWKNARLWARGTGVDVPPPTSLVLAFDFSNQGEPSSEGGTELDNLSVTRFAGDPPIKPGAKSVLVNGAFESGTFEPWSVFYGNKSGKRVIKLVSPGIRSQYAVSIQTFPDSLSQQFKTVPGTAYVFSFEYRLQTLFFRLTYRIDDYPYRLGYTVTLNATNPNKGGKYAVPFVAQYNRTTIFLRPAETYPPLILDNFSVKELAD